MSIFKIYHKYFIPAKLPIVLYLLYPAFFFGLVALIGAASAHPMIILFTIGMLIMDMECLLDVFCFMGIAGMEKNKLDFLQTSAKGMLVLKKGIIADGIRRLISTVLLSTMAVLLIQLQAPVLTIIFSILCTLGITELALIIIRFFTGIYIAALVSGFSAFLLGIAFFLPPINIVSIVIAALLYLILFYIGRLIILEKGKKYYYDTFNS